MIKFIFVRHGLSRGNKEKVYCGQQDIELNEQGLEQGRLVSEYIYKTYKVQAIYTSALCRTKQTVAKLIELTGIRSMALKELNERCVGVWEGHGNDYIKEHWPKDFALNQENSYLFTPKGGESYEQVYDRAVKGLKQIIKECDNKNGVVVIASHGGVMRIIESYMRDIPLADCNKIRIQSNASIMEVDYDNGKFTIIRKGYDEYLGEMKSVGLLSII